MHVSYLREISLPEALVGAIALEYVLLKFKPQTEDDDFRGAFHVLSGFSSEQLVGFIRAKDADNQRTHNHCSSQLSHSLAMTSTQRI
jgi:hypothetical protein